MCIWFNNNFVANIFLSFFLLHLAPLSTTAFKVFWNVPSQLCKNVRPDLYNITANRDRMFRGEKFVIFYERDLGLYPYCETAENEVKNECQKAVNGGVPQAVNMSAHLEKVRLDVTRAIPDPNYDGLAIIDYEKWRPLFDLNWSSRTVYRRYSIKLILERYPDLPKNSAEYLARYLFDYHGRQFFLETISTARKERPKAKWAWWDFPLCNYDVGYGGDTKCKPQYEIINDQLMWLFESSDILIPPIYFYSTPFSSELRQKHVYAKLVQTENINKKLYPRKLPIYAYTKMEYSVEWNNEQKAVISNYYSKADVCNSIKYPMDYGIDGVIIWSTSDYMTQRCNKIAEYMDEVLGPFVSSVIYKANKCSEKQCNGVGRCGALNTMPPMKCELAYQPESQCLCPPEYTGRNCEQLTWPSSFTLPSMLVMRQITDPKQTVETNTTIGTFEAGPTTGLVFGENTSTEGYLLSTKTAKSQKTVSSSIFAE